MYKNLQSKILLLMIFTLSVAHTKRNLADIRYRFTSCGTTGRSGPSFSTCQEYYRTINSPISKENLLFEFEYREYEGAQGFHVPTNGLYNITVAAAGGGRGICNFENGGFGYQRTIQVELTTDYELLVLVGHRGTGACDVIPKTEDIYNKLCRVPPANVADVESCNETWYNFTGNFHRQFYDIFGGGAGGGGSLVRARNQETKEFDDFPMVIVGGGGGTASVLHYDVIDDIGAQNVFLANHLAYRTFINGQFRTHDRDHNPIAGTRGFRFVSSNVIAGAGGGYSIVGFPLSINVDGRSLGRAQDFAEGGLDCTQSFIDAGFNIPYSGVYGGFGGGGGACGGGGGGGGYTGGAVLDVGETVPGGGGFSFIGDSLKTSFKVNEVGFGFLNRERDDGFVEIILANCGCVHECLINTTEDQFECLCPNDTKLTPDLSDCYTDMEIAVREKELPAPLNNGLYYKYVELTNSTFILSNDIALQSNSGLCALFWLGENSQVVLTTNVVSGSQRLTKLAKVKDGVSLNPTLADLLNSSVLVTGALLVGTGNCRIAENSISIGASIQTPTAAAVSIENFRNHNISVIEQTALTLAASIFLAESTMTIVTKEEGTTSPVLQESSALSSGATAGIVVAIVMVAIFLLAVVAAVSISVYNARLKSHSLHPNVLEIPASAFHYKDSLISNLAYTAFQPKGTSTESPVVIQNDHRYEVLSYTSEDEGALSPTEAEIMPIHGVTAPEHDFSMFNRKRRNTVIQDSEWNYPRANLIYMRELGEGQFGKVLLMKAKDIAGYSGKIPVAVKTLTSRDPVVIKKFYEEADLMKTFSHPNIVSLLGFSQEEEDEDSAPLMVLEFMQYGDLATFLKSHRSVDGQTSVIGERKFCAFASDIAKGLEFLSSMKYVHRDIAARNCLVGAGLHIKIADFGLARGVHDKDYYKVGGAAVLPVRWMAPECLLFGVFSSASDVWSFGVLLWEIVTYGRTPLGDTAVEDIIDAAQNKTLYHERPPDCPDCLYELMSECLQHNSDDRPKFTDIVIYLDKLNNATVKEAHSESSASVHI